MRAYTVILGAMLTTVFFVPAPGAAAPTYAGLYTDAEGVHKAVVTLDGICDAKITVRVTAYPVVPRGEPRELVASGLNVKAPDPCLLACYCTVPFSWSIAGVDLQLSGGGTAGIYTAWKLAGQFEGGVLEFTGSNIVIQ